MKDKKLKITIIGVLVPKRKLCEASHRGLSREEEEKRGTCFGFDLGGGIPPLKRPRLKGSIHMCSCHLLEFLNSHIRDKEGRKMTVNLQKCIV